MSRSKLLQAVLRWRIIVIVVVGVLGIPMANAAGGPPIPKRVVHTSHGTVSQYDTSQVLASPGVTSRSLKTSLVGSKSVRGTGSGKVAPDLYGQDGGDNLTVYITLTFTYYNDHFVCAFGAVSAVPNRIADMEMVGGLYYGTAYVDGFNISSGGYKTILSDETGCWNEGDAAAYKMTGAVVADYTDGGAVDLSGYVIGYAL